MLYTQLLEFVAITGLTAISSYYSIYSYHAIAAGPPHIPPRIVEEYDALFASMDQYSSHKQMLAAFSKAIQEQMVNLKDQVSDVRHEFGGHIQEEPDSVCLHLFILEEYLEVAIAHMAKMRDASEKIRRELIQARIMGKPKQEGWVLSFLHVRKDASQ